MPEEALNPDAVFAFRHLARALDGFGVPTAAFAADGAWTATYEQVERSARQVVQGTLRLERTPESAGRFRLGLTQRKRGGGGLMQARAEIRCQTDALASPLSWSLETEVLDHDGRRIADTYLAESGEIRDGHLCVRSDGRERRTALDGPVTMDWCLFDAVQRRPQDSAATWRFGLLDRLGTSVKGGQELRTGPRLRLALGGRRVWHEQAEPLEAGTRYRPVEALEGATAVTLQGYEHVGQGILPTTYWVDDRGQVLCVLAGLSAWILNSKAQA